MDATADATPSPVPADAAAEESTPPKAEIEDTVKTVVAAEQRRRQEVIGKRFQAMAKQRETAMLDRLTEEHGLTGHQRDEMEKILARRSDAIGMMFRTMFSGEREGMPDISEVRKKIVDVRAESDEQLKVLLFAGSVRGVPAGRQVADDAHGSRLDGRRSEPGRLRGRPRLPLDGSAARAPGARSPSGAARREPVPRAAKSQPASRNARSPPTVPLRVGGRGVGGPPWCGYRACCGPPRSFLPPRLMLSYCSPQVPALDHVVVRRRFSRKSRSWALCGCPCCTPCACAGAPIHSVPRWNA